MIYQIDILAHVYIGTNLSSRRFLSPLGKAEGYYSICYVLWGKNKKKDKKYSMISGFQLGYLELSPLHPSGTKSEILDHKRYFTAL